jgi:hypothetical protein
MVELAGGVFGHRLDELLDEANRLGLNEFVALTAEQSEAIKFGSDYYSNKILEYPALSEAVQGYPKMPDTELLISAGLILVSCKQRYVQSA